MMAEPGGENRVRQVVAVMSGKGGVGKSAVSGLLAVALRRRGYAVGILDADITGPSIPKMFGLRQPPPSPPDRLMPARTRLGILVESANLLLPEEGKAIIWRGPLISSLIRQLWAQTLWGDLDYLVVDLPPGTSDATLTVMQSTPLTGAILVSSPQQLAGMVVSKSADMARQMTVPLLGVVENMAYVVCPRCGERIEVFGPSRGAELAAHLQAPFLGQLPLDPELARLCDAGEIETYAGKDFAPIIDRILVELSQLDRLSR